MKNRYIKALLALSVMISVAVIGCSDPVEPGQNSGDTDLKTDVEQSDVDNVDVEEPDTKPPKEKICEPGVMLGCRGGNTPDIEVCSDDGMAIVPGVCDGKAICRDGACVEVSCVPGERKCGANNTPQICNEDAETFKDLEQCSTEEEGRCVEGFCLDRCKIAEVENSYIGCEYWAVELENHLINEPNSSGKRPLPPENHPPYAIVLANTSTSYDAEITVYSADGQFAQAVPSRRVGTDSPDPVIEIATVYSEVLDENGVQIAALSGDVDKIVLPSSSTMTLILKHRTIPFGATSLTKNGYQVVSSQPVIAYQFNPICCNYNYSNDASLLLPTSALTENYMFMSHTALSTGVDSRGNDRQLTRPYGPALTVVATKPDTEVEIQLRKPRRAGNPSATSPDARRNFRDLIYGVTSDRISGPDNKGLMKVTMQPFEVLNVTGKIKPVEDLSGARITSNKPVAVFGGHTCANVPSGTGACDHLESQLFPMETWGRNFVAAPVKLRNPAPNFQTSREGTYWKFMAREDNTIINTNPIVDTGNTHNLNVPNVLPTTSENVPHCSKLAVDGDAALGIFKLDAGDVCEFGTFHMFNIESTKPIMVGAFVSGQQSVNDRVDWGDYAGDPSFYLLPPNEQFRTSYAFMTPSTYYHNYITVTVPNGTLLKLDGETIRPTDWPDHELSKDGSWVRAHIRVEEGPHTITAASGFGIVIYGYDNYVSYAFTGGLDLVKLDRME